MARQITFAAVLAVFSCSAVLADDPSAETFVTQGNVWIEKGELDKAIADYSEAIRLDPKDAITFGNRAAAWTGKGEWGKAIKDLTEAIRLDPKDATAYFNRGVSWSIKGEHDNAIKDFTEAIRLDPKDANVYASRAMLWAGIAEYSNAIKDYTEAIRIDPTNAINYGAFAWLRGTCPDERCRDGKQALANATTACELSAWKEGGYIDTLATAYAESGDFPNAIKWEEKAIELTSGEKVKAELGTRLVLFKEGKPYREMPSK